MKKLISAALVLALVLSFAVSCAKKEKTDWEYIKAKKELIIGITYYAPMNYLDDSGKLVGFETEFA
ncbi:MAG: amino acid ABC transporter substrate-binding protein, partial [Oscillospiraceae bacterium]|nr:amino acid ABC transporter substrate-binding protein [Oscillospiraceae bacterium]